MSRLDKIMSPEIQSMILSGDKETVRLGILLFGDNQFVYSWSYMWSDDCDVLHIPMLERTREIGQIINEIGGLDVNKTYAEYLQYIKHKLWQAD